MKPYLFSEGGLGWLVTKNDVTYYEIRESSIKGAGHGVFAN